MSPERNPVYRAPRRYGLTLGEIEDLASTLAKLDELCDGKPVKNRIEYCHSILERALGPDAGHIYYTGD